MGSYGMSKKSKLLTLITPLLIAACTPVQKERSGDGYVVVHDVFWGAEHDTPYPFTTSGEITCSDHIELGRGVFFNPVGFTDESYVGTPLNKAAADIIKLSRITPNVPYSIKKGADLSEAREVGLSLCEALD